MAEPFITWRISGRSPETPPPADWRDRLARHLGERPRRLGIFTELALFGALETLEQAGERTLHKETVVRVCSLRGAVMAISQVLEQIRTDLPLPFSFLQSQPSQMLAALSSALGWQGDASFTLARDPIALVNLAARQALHKGMLLGWVEEENGGRSQWLRLVPCQAPALRFLPATRFEQVTAAQTEYLQLQPAGIAFA